MYNLFKKQEMLLEAVKIIYELLRRVIEVGFVEPKAQPRGRFAGALHPSRVKHFTLSLKVTMQFFL